MELATGLCEDFKMYNIYDMAGNFWEWTSESSKENFYDHNSDSYFHYAVFRDTGFAGDGFNDNCSMLYRRGDLWDTSVDLKIGFRVILYLK